MDQCIHVKVLVSVGLCFSQVARSLDPISLDLADNRKQHKRFMGCASHASEVSIFTIQGQNLVLVAVTSHLPLDLVAPSEPHSVNVYCLLLVGLWTVFGVSCNAVRRTSRQQCCKRASGQTRRRLQAETSPQFDSIRAAGY